MTFCSPERPCAGTPVYGPCGRKPACVPFRGTCRPKPQQNIAAVHDLPVPFLKCFQHQSPRIFLPVGQKLPIPDPRRFRSQKSNRVDPPGSAGDDLGDFPASQSVLPAKCAEILIPHHEVRNEIKLSNGPASGNSKFHKRGAPVTSPREPPQPHPECKRDASTMHDSAPFQHAFRIEKLVVFR